MSLSADVTEFIPATTATADSGATGVTGVADAASYVSTVLCYPQQWRCYTLCLGTYNSSN